MSSNFFLLEKPKKKKNQHAKSERDLRLPSIKMKFGPNTPISSPYDHLKNFNIPKVNILAATAKQFHSPIMRQSTFFSALIAKYQGTKMSHNDLLSKFVRTDEINLYWSKINTRGFIPDARTGASMNYHHQSLYVFAGERADQNSDIKRLDCVTLIWDKVVPKNLNNSEIPIVMSGHATAIYKHYLIVYGGFSSFDPLLQIRSITSLVYCLDLETSIWKSYKPTGSVPEPRRGHSACSVGNSFVIYSGMDCRGNLMPNLAVLNMEEMSWVSFKVKGDIPPIRKECTLTPVYDQGVLDHYGFDVFNSPKHYDNVANKNTSGIYMFGGLSAKGRPLNDVYILKGQPNKNKPLLNEFFWTKIVTTGREPTPRHGHTANYVNGFLIILGGRNDDVVGGIVGEISVLRISNWRWETVNAFGDCPHARIGASAVSVGTRILLFGGMHLTEFASATLFELETDSKKVIDLISYK